MGGGKNITQSEKHFYHELKYIFNIGYTFFIA